MHNLEELKDSRGETVENFQKIGSALSATFQYFPDRTSPSYNHMCEFLMRQPSCSKNCVRNETIHHMWRVACIIQKRTMAINNLNISCLQLQFLEDYARKYAYSARAAQIY